MPNSTWKYISNKKGPNFSTALDKRKQKWVHYSPLVTLREFMYYYTQVKSLREESKELDE